MAAGSRPRFRCESPEVWHLARALNKPVYSIARRFPQDETFGLTSPLRRAPVSIYSNIAEGSGKNSDNDFAHFLVIAYGFSMEVVSQLFIALDEGYLARDIFDQSSADANVLAGKLVALSKSPGRSPRISQPSTLDSRP